MKVIRCLKPGIYKYILEFCPYQMYFQDNAESGMLVTESFVNCFNEFQNMHTYINMHEEK